MLVQLLSRVITRMRGTPFRLDPALPASYLLHVSGSYVMRRMRGALRFPFRRGAVFVGSRCTFFGKAKIRFAGPLNVGNGCIINAISSEGVVFGPNVSLQRQVAIECTGSLQTLGKGVVIGANVGIGSMTFLGAAGGIRIGDDTIIGNFVSFHAENHNFHDLDRPIHRQGVNWQGIEVGRDCWIGAKVTLLDGARVGDQCVIAAGAVVKAGHYPPRSILAGVPARIVGTRGQAARADDQAPQTAAQRLEANASG
jgi:acetyltransferase-like isoleucine patch superfamily enzyme